MLSKQVRNLSIIIATISILAFAVVILPGSDADGDETSETTYRFYLVNSVDGEDSAINGWYTGTGTTVVSAFCEALDTAKIPYKGFTPDDRSIFFGDKSISDWSVGTWATDGDYFAAQFAIWNYNEDKGWFLGNTFGTDPDTVYIISHEKYYDADGAAAAAAGVDAFNAWGDPADFDLVYDGKTGGYADLSVAMKVWSKNTYGGGDPADFGVSLKEGSTEYDSATDAALAWMATFDGTAYHAPAGMYLGNAQYGYAQLAPQNLMATPDKVVFGPVSVSEYTFILKNTVAGEDTGINGTYTGIGANPVQALIYALDKAGIANVLDWTAVNVVFDDMSISDWSSSWDSSATDCYGPNYAVWNYNEDKGWFLGNKFGTDTDTVYTISHENYYVASGKTASSLGVSQAVDGSYACTNGLMVQYSMYVQTAPRDASATPEEVIFGPVSVSEYTFILNNSVTGEDSSINGTYTGIGTTPVEALVYALNNAKIAHKIDYTDPLVFFDDTCISDWSVGTWATDGDYFAAQFAIWNYNETDGWFIGDIFGKDADTVYLISHEKYYDADGMAAAAAGVDAFKVWGNPADFDLVYDGKTGGYADVSVAMKTWWKNTYDVKKLADYGISLKEGSTYENVDAAAEAWLATFDGTAYFAPAGMDASNAKWAGYIQLAPQDLKATPDKVVFGPVSVSEYTFILNNTVAGEDISINGTYTGIGANPVQALIYALDKAGIAHTLDRSAESIDFGDKSISDWSSSWDSSATDCYGPNYAIWNYNEDKGWFLGNKFGKDSETVYMISHENYYVASGKTAASLGVSQAVDGSYACTNGLMVQYNMYVQIAPRDASATPEEVIFGPKPVSEYIFILNNSVTGEDISINGTYTGIGTTPVEALVYALNNAKIAHTIDYTAKDMYFGDMSISDWSSSWDSSATDCYGPNYAVWNYNEDKGWFLGSKFGKDSETVYTISHENYYVASGKTAASLGVSQAVDGSYACTNGLMVQYNMYVQTAPRDASATPEEVIFGPKPVSEYTFILNNSVTGEDRGINGTYIGIGTTPVEALVYALNNAKIAHTIDYTAKDVYFGDKSISDWSSSWDSSATDCYGPNYAVWNYNEDKGWFLGNKFGTDTDTVYLISHENYYVASGPSATLIGVKYDSESGSYIAPVGLLVQWDMYVQTAPMDYQATPEELVFKPYFFMTIDCCNGTDPTRIAGTEGSAISVPADPSKSGYVFLEWSIPIPATMPAYDLTIKAVWGSIPVETDSGITVDLVDNPNFKMPETNKSVTATLKGDASVTITDNASLAGKIITSTLDSIENKTGVDGKAYEFIFTANGSEYHGKLRVSIPYSVDAGKVPVVYYVNDAGEKTAMNVISYTDGVVTFETDHNSVYVLSSEDKNESVSTLNQLAMVLLVILVVFAAAFAIVKSTRKQ